MLPTKRPLTIAENTFCPIPETKLYALKDGFELIIWLFVILSLLMDEEPICILFKANSCFLNSAGVRLAHCGLTDQVQALEALKTAQKHSRKTVVLVRPQLCSLNFPSDVAVP